MVGGIPLPPLDVALSTQGCTVRVVMLSRSWDKYLLEIHFYIQLAINKPLPYLQVTQGYRTKQNARTDKSKVCTGQFGVAHIAEPTLAPITTLDITGVSPQPRYP